MFELTTQLASFAPPPPDNLAVLRALRSNQAQTNHFFRVLTGSVPIAEFFSPLNLVRILGPVNFARVMVSMGRPAPVMLPSPA